MTFMSKIIKEIEDKVEIIHQRPVEDPQTEVSQIVQS